LIPALAPCRRLSKSLIVHESVEYLQSQRESWITAADEIQALLAENLQVVAELNTWRELHGLPPKQAQSASDTLQKLLKVKEDVLGTFPGGFGDNPAEDNRAGETSATFANSREQQHLSRHQESEAETMQLDLPPSTTVDMQLPVVAAGHVPEAVPHRPSLSQIPSHHSFGYGHNMAASSNHLDPTQFANNQLQPDGLDLIMPYDETFGISPILDHNLQPFPVFNLQNNELYGNAGASSPGLSYFVPPIHESMYYNAQAPQQS
jgi:hypothetical protein